MRILLFSTLFPNAAAPAHGIFVENRLSAYRKKYDAEVKVVAPVPWFPFSHPLFGRYGAYARAPRRETRHGVDVFHPRFFIPPKLGMQAAPVALARCLRKEAKRLIAEGWDFDFIDAHYFYPDGVAAADVARELEKPFAVTARGTDVNLLPHYEGPRKKILDAAWRADAVMTVADALKQELARLGAPAENITVLRNGVDLEKFSPADREAERRVLGLDGLVLASVGQLIERKGHGIVIDALKDLPSATLLIVGEGPERKMLEARARLAGVAERVRFLGQADHDDLRRIYSAADILVLASSREGWPNVLLEAMACGTPCVASDVWGTSEVIAAPEAGRLAKERTPRAIAGAVKDLLASPSGRKAARAYAEKQSWEETADGMQAIFCALEERSRAASALKTSPVVLDEDNKRPRLIVTVDTEEEFDWRRFDGDDYRVSPMDGVERFQALCREEGAAPLYFLTWPILKDERAAPCFQSMAGAGVADFGLHLHQWTTPPGNFTGEYFSFQKNLPRQAYREKLKSLAGLFEDVFSEKPLAHRAGRYGIGSGDYELLAEFGLCYDFSPSAAFDFSSRGGPDFSTMSNKPFIAEADGRRLVATPVTGARALRGTSYFLSQEKRDAGFAPYKKDPFSVFKIPMRLSPEGGRLEDLQALTRAVIDGGAPVLTYTLHSTSLTPGASPYARDETGADEILATTAAYLSWFRETLGGEIVSFKDLRALYDGAGEQA
ncbi:glycosyltransferase [Hyphococcus luteus]|uniref:Glycosyl transferase family 1 n=1 Tax=Hyphococcus luteus TaxID=2058213 RepID=A0A2S7K941_9PROT|nr:glycosyltransferase [Marinicaulis flavus]PQA89001.1 hypothetical protein CW354_03365 [Marinicaulis flavus]